MLPLAFLVAALAAAAHHQVLWNDFVNLDDQLYVTGNARVARGLSANNLRWALTSFEAYNWHPITWMSHMADIQLWGFAPRWHHLTSLLFHAANAVLLLLFLWRATGAVWRAAAVAAIFAVHPIHVESVAWIAERKDVLFTFFYLATLFVYAKRPLRHHKARALSALALFACALMAKPMAVTLPLVLVIVDWWPLQRWPPSTSRSTGRLGVWVTAALEKLPFFILAAGTAALTILAQNRSGTGTILYESPLGLNLRNALVSYVRYLGKAFWPLDLAIVYPFRSSDLTTSAVAGAAALLAALSLAAWRLRRSAPYLLAGWLWFLVTLLPVIGALRFGRHAIADRYAYVPFIGIYVAVVWGTSNLIPRLRLGRMAALAAIALVLATLGVLTIRQEIRWRNSRALFEHAIVVTRDNAVAHMNLGIAYAAEGDYARAASEGALGRMLEARDIVEFQPNHPVAHYRLGNAYAEMGRHMDAIGSFREALRLRPDLPGAWNNLGVSLAQVGRVEEALEAFSAALRVDPNDSNARVNMKALQRTRADSGERR